MNLWSARRLGRVGWLRRLAKGAFRAVLRHDKVYPVACGPLQGFRWLCRSEQPFWMPLGLYEPETSAWIEEHLAPGQVFFDVGAHAGYFTLLASRCTGPTGRVVAFEPLPGNAEVIRRQLAINGCCNAQVEASAVSSQPGSAQIHVTPDVANTHLADIEIGHADGTVVERIEVPVTSIDAFIAETGLRPSSLKVDVEGAELEVLEGGRALFEQGQLSCIVSTHSQSLRLHCEEWLRAVGYTVRRLPGFEHEVVAEWTGNSDGA